MTKTKKRIGRFNIALGIVFIVCWVLVGLGERFAFTAYQAKHPDWSGSLDVAVIIIIYGILGGLSLVALGIFILVFGIITLNARNEKITKSFTIVDIVLKILASSYLLFYTILNFIYSNPAGLYLKIIYIAIALLSIATSVWDIIAINKVKKTLKVKPVTG